MKWNCPHRTSRGSNCVYSATCGTLFSWEYKAFFTTKVLRWDILYSSSQQHAKKIYTSQNRKKNKKVTYIHLDSEPFKSEAYPSNVHYFLYTKSRLKLTKYKRYQSNSYCFSTAWPNVWASDRQAHGVVLPEAGCGDWERRRTDGWVSLPDWSTLSHSLPPAEPIL